MISTQTVKTENVAVSIADCFHTAIISRLQLFIHMENTKYPHKASKCLQPVCL